MLALFMHLLQYLSQLLIQLPEILIQEVILLFLALNDLGPR